MNVIGMHTTTTTIKEKIQLYLLQLLSKTLGKTVDTIDITAGFFDLGMDSKMTMELVATLEEKVGHELYPTLLFEYQSIDELSQYLTENDSNSFVSEAVSIDSNIEYIEKGEKTKTAVKDVTIELIQEFLQELAAQTLEKSITEIDITAGFFDLGMDSKMTMQLVADLEEKVEHELYPTLLFEYQSIEELSQYLFENDKEAFSSKETRVSEKITYKQPVQDNEVNQQENVFEEIENDDFEEDIWEETMVDEVRNNISQTEVKKELIAIVGVSGRYPKANTIAEFWKNLKEGKDCVSEMPQNRWNKNSRYPKELLTGKWGGFIEDVDKFDPLHFKIAPAEAEFIDPQVRLFLEESWNVIEDAGYRLATDEDKNVGVFVGSMFNSYPSAAADKKTTDKLSFNTGWTIANRVSYHLGLTGPSMHINTACSSSLTAIIEACQSIQNGLCSAAIAGGVNLSLDALKWEHLQEFGLLGSSKESRSFTQGDGYLPGEGVGAILLKPLSKAEQDGDQIYGIIRGGSLNHNGAGNGFTVPNPKAQAALIKEAIEKSEVNLNDISYVEAAANGSAMGDSIEITALSHLFSTDKKPVALGSVKAQIGHLESASGISQVTKVLLQLKNKTLVPGIGKQPLNPNLGLKRTSLEINDTLKPWDDKGNPRMAMINNFGAGGANANIIIQEYTKTNKYLSKDSAIILLSAKTETALKKQATNLYLYLENHKNSKLHDIAYTLQLGREAMEERLALIVSTVEELKYRLEVYLQGQKDAVLLSNVSKGKTDFVLRGKAGKAYVNVAIKEKELDSLIQLWLKGVDLDWSLLYDEFNKPTKVSLPTYPFEKESYWIPEIGSKKGYETVKLHPLVHTNTSDFYAQKFESTFTEEEVFLRKNQFSKTNIFSEISSIEFIREAGKRSLGLDITGLQNLSWLKNIQVTNSLHQLGIRLFENEAKINYEIHALNSEKTVYLTGELNTGIVDKPIMLNIELLERELSNYKDKNDCNTLLQNIGINGANCIDYVKSNDSEALIKITHNKENSYINYLEILDKVFCTGIEVVSGNMSFVTEPSAIKEVLFYGDMTLTNWCYVSKCKEENKITYDIDFLSEKGMVLLSLKGVKVHKVAIVNPDATFHTFKPLWKEQLIREIEVKEAQKEVVVLVGNDLALVNQFNENGREVIYVNELSTVGYYEFIQEVIQAKLKEKVHTSITIVYDTKVHHNYAFISGLLKTASIESPKISGKTIGINSSKITSDQLQEILRKEKRDVSVEVIYEGGIRKVKRNIPVNNAVEARNIKENGVYLITGGAGGLGYIFAKHIAKTKGTKIVLTGRSKQCKLSSEELKTLNASYYTCDITNYEEVSKLVQALVQDYGKLNGVIHAAGVLKDNFLIQKTTTEAVQVLNPKIIGTQNLDEATKELSLDFMVYFASLSGVLGNAGQADYSSANSWMDNYALYRNRLKEEGKRFGHTLSIDWPLWKNGGMQIDEASKVLLDEKYGIKPLPTGEGIKAFEIFLSNKIEQGVVVYGNTSKITKKLAVTEEEITKEIVTQTKAAKLSTEELKQKVEKDIIDLIAATLKIESSRLDRDTNFSNYGVESAMITSFTKALNELYKGIEVSSTIFVTNPTINELVTFLIEEYSDVIQQQTITAEIKRFNIVNDVKFIPQINKNNRFIKSEKEVLKTIENNIAITGISGRFSTADSEEDLWKKSILGTSLEINQDLQYSSLTVKERTTGWQELNISVEEASQMSIQEQLIFDELAKMIEHYSIDKKTLSTKKTGVFIAAQEIYGSKNEIKEGHHTLAYLIPNKISYYLNLKGPSEIVNSYCTSAYVAIHKAIQSIQSGECEQAIIGGVNLVSPEEMAKAMASDFNSLFSKSGKTESFSDTAEGFVRSEGVAVMLIKPLQDAEKEKNTVLGVIKGSAVYHGGKGFSIEAPNSKGIKSAIETSVLKSNIPVNTIDYIEAHGIANKMADAIELGAINSVYTKHSEDKDKKWHVSTSKPTIGHSELVSGMASLIKVLKAFEHKTIPGISGLDSVNSELAPNHSFILTKESCAWKNGLHPRRASLNSFAVGGVNAHLILEEYTQESVDTPKGGIIQEVTELKIKEVPEKDVDTTSIKAIIKNISQEVFQINKEEFDENLSPIDYDFDSIKVIEFVNRINEHFKINVKMGQILGADDFKSMFDVFESVVKEETKDNEINEFSEAKNVPVNYSLSEGQKGLWFIQKKEPETTIYNIPIVFKAANTLSNDSIYKSFKFLVQKYPILNVAFSINEDTGELLQTVQDKQNIQYTVQKLKQGETIESTIKKLQHVPFNLTQEVSRLYVIEHEELQEKAIVFILHHIVFDGSSITPFIADFKSLISQIQIDDEFFSADYEVDTTFFDYIKEEENYLKSKEADEDFNFWKQKLDVNIQKIELPYAISQNLKLIEDGFIQQSIKGVKLEALKSLTKLTKVNLSIIMLAAFKVLLHKITGSEDIIVKMPTAGRSSEKYKKSIGYFINRIISTVFVTKQESFSDLIKKLRSEFIDSLNHIKYPYTKVVTSIDAIKGNSDAYFPVSFTYQNIFSDVIKNTDDSEVVFNKNYQQKLVGEYGLEIIDLKDELVLQLKYKKKLFSDNEIEKHLEYLIKIINKVVSNSDITIQNIELLTSEERHKLLTIFNATNFEYPIEGSGICEQIEKIAKASPKSTALTFGEKSITYLELLNRSRQLAIYLQKKGVVANTLVGVFMERSIETVVSMIGILMAGGAYVPLDIEYPKDRIAFMIEDAILKGNKNKPPIILAQFHVKKQLSEILDTKKLKISVVSIKQEWGLNKTIIETKSKLKNLIALNNLAYVIYTSGSTGNPKGVLIEHRSFIDLIQYQKNYFEINESDKFIQFSNFSFDASVEQIFLPLVSGATLHIVPKEELLNIDKFTSLLVEKEITHLHAVPLFLRELPYIPNTHLKRIISGGDVFDQKVLNTWGDKGIRIIDKYGPTETTVSAVQRELEFPLKGKHIGRPLGNTYCYVVDGNNQLQPIGVPGELCIGGAGLARGYLNREELTHEKFIDNPFGEGKIYKTGDLVRWLPSGNIDFLGRIDFQVKIRGFRIELGEVEHAVNGFKAVKKSVVIAKDYLGSKQLVAYCEVYEEEFKIQEIKEYLSEKLPEYMVPKFIISIDKIPLTSSGKANRKQLQNKDLDIVGEEEFVAPQTHTEKRLAIIWQELLNSKLVGVYDNFFELGGHSLLITRLLSKLNQEFSVEIPISKVFEFPTLKALAGIIDGSQKQITTSIEVVKNRENQPLSFAQQRLWFLSELGQGDQYHIPYILRVKGSLNISVLEKSLNTLIQRHEILRTTFRKNENGDAYQFIEKEVSLKIKKENYTDIELQEETIKNRCTSFITEPFDLSKDLLMRALVIKVSEADYIFSLCIHHIVFDGWSMNVFMQELKKLYEAYLNEEKITLPNLPIQYLDYAVWQQMQTENPLVREKIEHWKNHLEDYKDLAIVTDYPRPKIVSGKGKRITRTLSSSTKTKLQSYSNQLGGTLFTGLLSSVYILLNKYSGQNDICLGIPVANRNHKEIEELLGFFVNTVVNRIQTEDNDSLAAIFTKVQKELLRSQEYQDIPFDKVVEVVQPNRETSITPIFQVIVNYLKAEENFSLGTAEVAIEGFEYNKAKFDLNFDFVDIGNDNLVLSLVYNTDIFSDVTAANMLKYLQYILDNFMLNSNELLKNYSILIPEDEYELLAEVNSKTVNYSEKSSITELFSIQAGKTPKAIALAFENEYLTYEELESRSNQLAGYLQKIGISNETLVGICMDKSIEMMVSILAILKAGGAYVPIDASYPKERIEYIIEDSIVNGNKESLKLIIVNESVELKMSDFVKEEIQTLTIFKEWKNNEEIVKNTAKVISAPTANNLAYVIYTSGSTGKPKGVMVEHKSVIRLVKNAGYYNFDEGTTILATGAISFDATIFEFFGPLLNGGKLVLTNQDTLLNNQLLLNAIEQNKVDVMWFTSSWLNQIVDSDIEVFKSLKTILAGGERLSPKHIKKLRSNYPEIEIINGYGPTENTTFSITHNIKEVTGDIPLGLPISNDRVYIVSNHLKLQPKGVLGELCVGGNGVARGYLNQQELTSEKFIDNPFGEGKIYRTGDLARWTNEGVIEFFGRIDHQVKIRGFRIELEEIEQVLNEYTNIEESAVIVKEHLATKQLVAYCVLKNETTETIKELKSYLSEKLPEYMVPKFILKINELPLTPNGKLDRKLLVSKPLEVTSEEEFVKPRTETEKKLAIIWKELLTVETVGVYDNFFELGGHSLLITRLVSKVNKEMDVVLPISKVFEHPTLETMAENVDKSQKQAFTSIKVVENREYQSLSFAQQRLWFLSELGQGDQYHIPYLIRIKGNLEVDILEESLNYLIERHEILRTKFHKNNKGKAFQYIENRATINITQEDYSEFPLKIKEESIKRFCENFIYKSFDLSKDLLVRALVIKVSKEEYVFGLCIHHIIFDGWSLDIFMRELKAVYEQSISKKEINLPSLPIQYLDYSVWQQAQAENELFIEKIEHWKNHLENYNDLSLPTDYPRPKISTGRGKRIVKAIDSSVKVQLTALTTKSGGTLFSGLLSSVYILLAKYSGQKDICLGIPVANRTHKEAEGLIGFFVNTIVSRLQFKEEDSLLDILKKTHKELIRGQEYQEIPFDKVVEAVQPTRETSITPIFQVMVNYLKMEEKINFGSTVATIEELAYDKVKFDLSIDFIDTEDKGLMVSLGYSTDLYSDDTAERLLENLHNVLKALAFDSTEIFKEHSFVTAQETTQLLTEFNATQFDYSITGKSIQAEFEQQVKIQPNAIALTFGDISITYKELANRSKQLAIYLQNQGVEPDTLVGIFMERSIEAIVSMLGVLMSGGAYVPIDPDYPESRINFIIDDAIIEGNKAKGVHLILTQQDLAPRLNDIIEDTKVTVISIQSDWKSNNTITKEKGKLTQKDVLTKLAYVIYTSGSTGNPKGVLIEHTNVINLIKYQTAFFKVTSEDQILLFSSFSFDASIEQIYLALLNGGTLHLVSKTTLLDMDQLKNVLVDKKITHLHAVPTFLREIPFIENTSLKRIISGGDVFDSQISDNWGNKGIILIDEYGPTETTVTSIQRTIELPLKEKHIGKPLGNTYCYVVDETNKIQPIGIPGELWIGGKGVSRGYLNRSELTKEKFIENPFGEGRVYKTGDLVRRLPNGNIDFLGRIDQQVKIRGFRIELEEIETVINTHDFIKNNVVLAVDHLGTKQLVTYFEFNEDTEVNIQELRESLHQKLPEYMVPKFIIPIDKIPLTPNGKVNRKFLQTKPIEISREEKYVAPTTKTEKILEGIWKNLLGVNEISIYDNFFELGGHSLLLIQLIQQIKEVVGKSNIQLVDLISSPTIKQQASIIEVSQGVELSNHLVTFNSHSKENTRSVVTFIIPGMPGIVDGYYELAELFSKNNETVYGIQMQGVFAGEEPFTSIEEMALHNIKNIKKTGAKEIRLVAHSYGGTVVFEMLKQLQKESLKISEVLFLDSHAPTKSLKVIEKYKGLLGALLSMIKVKPSEKSLLEFSGKIKQQPKAKRKDFVYNFIISLGGEINREFYERIFAVYLNSIEASYELKEPVTAQLKLVKASQALVKNTQKALGWTSYFSSVEEVESSGTHFELVKKPFTNIWKNKLDTLSQ